MRRLAALGFQSQARPPLPCHFVPIRRAISERDVSISGETTAPLPPSAFPAPAPLVCCFNLRRDHRSLATSWEREATVCSFNVSISGETTAPLPHRQRLASPLLPLCFNLRRDHRSLATLLKSPIKILSVCFNLRRDHRSLAT